MKVLCGSMAKYDSYGVDTGTLPEVYFGEANIRLNSVLSIPIGGSIEFLGIKWDNIVINKYRLLSGDNTTTGGGVGIRVSELPTAFGVENVTPGRVSFTNKPATVDTFDNIKYSWIQPENLLVIFSWQILGQVFHDPTYCKTHGVIIRDASNIIVWEWLTSPSDFKSTPPNATIQGTLGWYYQGISRHDETKEAMLAWINSTTLTENLIIWDLDQNIPYGYFPSSKDGYSITVENGLNPPVQTGSIFPKCRSTISIGV